MRDNANSVVAYKSYLSDPSVTSPFTTRSSKRPYKGYKLEPSPAGSYRSTSVPRYGSLDDDDGYSDDEEDYRPRSTTVSNYSRQPKSLYYTVASPEGSDVEYDDDDNEYDSRSGTYSYSRPLGASNSLNLSSYGAPHDGSYEADMAEMYDYVPFGPSCQGILELTQHGGDQANDDPIDTYTDFDSSYSSPYTSSLPSYPSPSSTYTSSIPPSVSLIPHHHKPSLSDLASSSSSLADRPVFESIVANTAARAREVLRDTKMPYKDASLVLSVEGSALSEDGKNRYGFRYYPPPIPLKGSGVGLDERLLGIVPPSDSPADRFLGGYLSRLRGLRTEMENRADSAEERAGRCRSVVPRPLPPLPSYSHQTIHMPVQIAGRAQSVPVSSYHSRLDDGRSHRVDVFPLVETQSKVSKHSTRLPLFKAGGGGGGGDTKLSLIDKINIKVKQNDFLLNIYEILKDPSLVIRISRRILYRFQ